MRLLADLRIEVASRAKTVQDIESRLDELRRQRALLDLTNDQKTALQQLLRRQPSPGDIFTSLDFWLGRVFVSVVVGSVFFALGIYSQRRRMREYRPPESSPKAG